MGRPLRRAGTRRADGDPRPLVRPAVRAVLPAARTYARICAHELSGHILAHAYRIYCGITLHVPKKMHTHMHMHDDG